MNPLHIQGRRSEQAFAAQSWNKALTTLRAAHLLFRAARSTAREHNGPAVTNRQQWTSVDKALNELDEQVRVAFITARDESYRYE